MELDLSQLLDALPHDWPATVGWCALLVFLAYVGVKLRWVGQSASKAARQTEATGNGFAAGVREALARLESAQERAAEVSDQRHVENVQRLTALETQVMDARTAIADLQKAPHTTSPSRRRAS